MNCCRSVFAAAVLACLGTLTHAASLEIFRVNLDPLIDKAAHRQPQFAVDVARRMNSESSGTWTVDGINATWEYSIRIPTAVSMAFHATRLTLPAQGTLILTGGGQSFTYNGRDLHRAEFWSRPLRGDEIAMRITVPRALRHQALMQVDTFQAGYKSLSAGIADHPHYRALMASVSAATTSCVENYACDATPQTQNEANASVAIVISNKFVCSGTLLNDVPQDGAPYVLTARHCENGLDGGGDPGAASSVEVFWNSVTPCGQALLSIFDSYSQTQYGAITVVEQQDEWLLKLDSTPSIANAYFAGWDASGGALVGGYTIDYAGANTQQYVTWAGNAATVDYSASALQLGYASTYWGVVNSRGSIDRGASGAGIFNANNLLVGSSSRAVLGQCPANPPPVPSKDTQVALFNRFASTWNSTADSTSSTHVTIQAVLDPDNTGATSVTGIAGIPPSAYLFTSQAAAQTGTSILLQFNTTIGAVCTATGGVSGDGWSGTLNAYPGDSITIVENNPGVVTYGMKCVSGNRSSSAQVSVTWSLAPPTLTFYAGSASQFVGVSDLFIWHSNQSSCAATGGMPGDGWAGSLSGSGQVQVTETQPGTYSYTLNCGTGNQAISQTLTLIWGLPTASMHLFTDPGLRIGQNIWIQWAGSGDCTASGGAPGDGWAGPLTGAFGNLFVTEQSAGTYVFTVSCGPAAVAATAQVTYDFSGAPATAALTPAQSSYLIDLAVQAIPNLLTWTSNVQPCELDYAGPESGLLVSGYPAHGTDNEPRRIAGTYTYTLTCGTGPAQATATTTINWTQQPNPKVILTTRDGNEFPLLTGGFLRYSTNVLPCTGTGGTPGDNWTGNLPFYGGPNDFAGGEVIEPVAGTYTFTITCGVGNTASAQATVVYNNLGGSVLTLTPGGEYVSIYAGQPVLLAWTSAIGPCTGYGGTTGDGWSGPHPQQGSLAVIEPLGFDGPLSLVCGTGSAAVEAQSLIWVYAPASAVTAGLSASPSRNEVGHTVSLQWSSYEAASCTATGGVAGDGWTGTLPFYSGSMAVVESQPGTVSYGLTCQNGSLSDHVTMSVQWDLAPTITLSSSTQSTFWSTPFTLTWSSGNGASNCNATEDDGTGFTFSGYYGDSGSLTLQESSGAQHSYTMSCQSNYGVVQAKTVVNFKASTSGSGSGGSGSGSGGSSGGSSAGSSGGGGGDLDAETIALLALVAALRIGVVRVRLRKASRARASSSNRLVRLAVAR
jgi:lysyl endopeptidase